MSPKKRKRRPERATVSPTSPTSPASPASGRARRIPVVIDEPARWPAAVWTALTLLWALGSPLFFLFYFAEAFALAGGAPAAEQTLQTMGGYLVGLLACALLVPLVGLVWALWLRRRIAAGMFALVLLASTLAIVWLAPPTDILAALAGMAT